MPIRLVRLAALWCAACLALASAPAALGADQDAVRRGVQSGKLKPLAEILARIQKTHPGRVLDVELEARPDGQLWYEITLLHKDGHRVELFIDAATGAEVGRQALVQPSLMSMAEVLRLVFARETGTVREAELKRPRQQPPVYDLSIVRPDGSEQRFLIDATSGQVLEQGRRPETLPAAPRQLPALIEAIERRYGGRAVEVEVKHDANRAPYYEIELQLPNGRGIEVDIDPATGRVLREGS
ncbi:PepSY domain-containing protein [Piscinibacter sp.]|uniref:PepSY domain-containing protein n=1 Tax=Piscinibacter sp. TaxID=1903157 RepID=UPI0039E69F3C